MATLRNRTNRDLSYHHNSILYTIPAGKDLPDVPEKAANHLMTHLGTRGLMSITFEDAKHPERLEIKTKMALAAQEKFEKARIQEFNRVNKDLEANRKPLNKPEDDMVEFSRTWGIALDEPYTVRDDDRLALGQAEERSKKTETKSVEQEEKIDKLEKMVDQLMKGSLIKERLAKLDRRTGDFKRVNDLVEKGYLAEAEEELIKLGV